MSLNFDAVIVDGVVDAIADDLKPFATAAARAAMKMPSYLDWRYIEPDLLDASSAPWLAVWSPSTNYTLLATIDDYQDDFEVTVEFTVPIGQFIDAGNAGLVDFVRQAQLAANPILAQLRTYAPMLPPPFDNQVNGTLTRSERSERTGTVYTQSWTLTVCSLGAT